jgi:hypothetical protein
VIDREGGRRLTTPRAVVRTLNSLRLLVPALGHEVDLPDLVWLQLVKGSNHKFYRWVEEYVASCAVSSNWRVSVGTASKQQSFEELSQLLANDYIAFANYRDELSEVLPGIAVSLGDKESEVPIYRGINQADRDRAIQDRRLASADHYRLYFALTQPQFAVRADDLRRLLNAADSSVAEVAELFVGWAGDKDPAIGTKTALVLDRLRQQAADSLSTDQAERLFLGMADCMDAIGTLGGIDELQTPAGWREAERCIPEPRKAMGVATEAAIEKAFGNGKSIGWLTALLRHEIFAHGRFGSRRQPESEWLFTDGELDLITKRMLARYRGMSLDDLLGLPMTLSTLFAWAQAGDPAEPRQLIQDAIGDDAGLVRILEGMKNWVITSNHRHITLSRDSIDPFLDYDVARERIDLLASDNYSPLQTQAKNLQVCFEDGSRF